MAASNDHDDARVGHAIVRGIMFAIPLGVLGFTVAIWLITSNDLLDSFATAILPGVMFGVFAGGFTGVATSME